MSVATEGSQTERQSAAAEFVFDPESFKDPKLPAGLEVVDVPLEPATNESLAGLGFIVDDPNDWVETSHTGGRFEITPWPTPGWRSLDPHTGDEAGTTEGDFDVYWQGDYFYGNNLAIESVNNLYLDGLGALPELASHEEPPKGETDAIYLWMSDYHPDGGQLFWPDRPIPFVVCLGPSSVGDDVKPEDMRAFSIPAGKGAYFHPGTWHNGVYVHRNHAPARFLTRQGRIHARVSASWANEFQKVLRVPLAP
mmetsp:Transcript_6384/g.16219  ORF Transcript_6384/g.16219 Transcript_6384/m.16219 type:complete len:252 (-) Transcript_6384:513-1268(-)